MGKSCPSCKRILKTPPSYGVPAAGGKQAPHISLGTANTHAPCAQCPLNCQRQGASVRGCAVWAEREVPRVRRQWRSTSRSQVPASARVRRRHYAATARGQWRC